MTTLNNLLGFDWLKKLVAYWLKVLVVSTVVLVVITVAFFAGPGRGKCGECPDKCPHCGKPIGTER